ncbi:MAG: hypothetical protein A2887_01900 [Alphaproteobacteria bacterium RIFCSPLOWO2_01_FULL_40_26]|nr:MAG: hypothetical protein A3D15_01265 [Alphaproteobacteria bacterium RIFCSPHIGHO2_02_FULL_40_34]OFW93947.1 MAG: hypothetical protein A2887_01900 [Alphaproteobacteria bacterium RIFCSPLOWO2_01_FULL_40_26]OFX09659.1 MAG: hypothetical protein A3H30_03255 [Alphaproteobacteria bacterium RIFCSPLOWO2_02_FULL_40_19]OFX11988.1 MAG: hypothetical protein A3G22_00705 [Alphaproteobacteria bacterium RIFCSPLOWO2_12_FULL_40_11]
MSRKRGKATEGKATKEAGKRHEPAEESDSENELDESYRDRYSGGDEGTGAPYFKRFRSSTAITIKERNLVTKSVMDSVVVWARAGGGDKFVIFDFGGGGGRFFELFRDIAARIPAKTEVICYDLVAPDPSYVTLLKRNGYSRLETASPLKQVSVEGLGDVEDQGTFACGESNPHIRFISGPMITRPGKSGSVEAIEAQRKQINARVRELCLAIKEVTGEMADASVAMFGSISHIMGHDNREAIFGMIREITKGYFATTLPAFQAHTDDVQRASDRIDSKPSSRLERGDAKYTATDGSMKLFYHHYSSRDDLRRELERAGFARDDIHVGISAITSPVHLLRDDKLDRRDAALIDRKVCLIESGEVRDNSDEVASYFEVQAGCGVALVPASSVKPLSYSAARKKEGMGNVAGGGGSGESR